MSFRYYSVTVTYFAGPKEKPGKHDPQVSLLFGEIKATSKKAAIQEVRDRLEGSDPLICTFAFDLTVSPSMIGVHYSAEQVH